MLLLLVAHLARQPVVFVVAAITSLTAVVAVAAFVRVERALVVGMVTAEPGDNALGDKIARPQRRLLVCTQSDADGK